MSNLLATRTQTRKSNCIWKSRKKTTNCEKTIWSCRKTSKRRLTWFKRCRKRRWRRLLLRPRTRWIKEWKRTLTRWSTICHPNLRYRDLPKSPILALRSVALRPYPKWWSWLPLLMRFSNKTKSIAVNLRSKFINFVSIFRRIHLQLTTSHTRNLCRRKFPKVNLKLLRIRIGPANKRPNLLFLGVIASKTLMETLHLPRNIE